MKEDYLKTNEEVLEELRSQRTGLSTAEAVKRQKEYGKNELEQAKKETLVQKFINELKDPMLIMLMAAAIISAITNIIGNEPLTEVFIIIAVVLLNAVLGVLQESKAEEAIEALKNMTKAKCKVMRDGKMVLLENDELVPGDIVILEAGDGLPADGRLIESKSLKIEEAALTGESVPVDKMVNVLKLKDNEKEITLAERSNMAYMGSTVVYGRGVMVVTAIGMDTQMGKIADVLNDTVKEETPLQKKLNDLGKKLSYLVIGICIFIFAFDLFRVGTFDLSSILETFMVAVSLAVAAIPEGLATVVTVVLSIGVTRMSKANAIIRRMSAVETLGCTSVICSDKTGTLTKNKMTVVKNTGDKTLLCKAMALCNDAVLNEDDSIEGEPTEAALVAYARDNNIRKYDIEKESPRVEEAPFDSSRKLMSTIHKLSDGTYIQYTKGAPDALIPLCKYKRLNNQEIPMSEKDYQEIYEDNRGMADEALRVLACAYKIYDKVPTDLSPKNIEKDLVYIGLAGMMDPVREEVIPAIRECLSAGIRPVMITGDHKDTAVAIAKQIGIIKSQEEAITGSELDLISDEDFDVTKYGVYARVKPEHKTRIVNAWKKKGTITAMTGDGVNDAPSIKSADIGIGMGITGTDVTKNVADMILVDDNFATIVKAIEEGRRIYDNIRKSIQFLLSSNMSEVFAIFVSSLMGFTLLKPVHLLFVNLITDCLPALALGMEEAEDNIMKRKPRDSKESIFASGMVLDVAFGGILIGALTIISYFVGVYFELGSIKLVTSNLGMTMAFLTLNMCEIFHSYNMRSLNKSIFKLHNHNKFLWLSMIVALVIVTLVLEVPFIASMFGLMSLGAKEYLWAIGIAIFVIPAVEILKLVKRMSHK